MAEFSLLRRSYHSFYHQTEPIIDKESLESKIYQKAMKNIPKLGFTKQAVEAAALDMKLLPNTISVQQQNVPLGLSLYYLKHCRQELNSLVGKLQKDNAVIGGELEKIKYLMKHRLLLNKPYVQHLNQLQAVLALNPVESLEELHALSDDIVFFSGDQSNDFAWYAKRGSVSSIYVQCELVMSQDRSKDFAHTVKYMENRLDEAWKAGEIYDELALWANFNAHSVMNITRSFLVRG